MHTLEGNLNVEHNNYYSWLRGMGFGRYKIGWENLQEIAAHKQWAKAACIILKYAHQGCEPSKTVKRIACGEGVSPRTYGAVLSELHKHGFIGLRIWDFRGLWWIVLNPAGYLFMHPDAIPLSAELHASITKNATVKFER